MNIPAMFGRAAAEFDARVRQVGDHQWQAATPDEDWTVRDLVNHLVGEDLWTPPLLAGSTMAEVGDRFEGDMLGAEPKAAWTAASAADPPSRSSSPTWATPPSAPRWPGGITGSNRSRTCWAAPSRVDPGG